jgi:hypothetical protein
LDGAAPVKLQQKLGMEQAWTEVNELNTARQGVIFWISNSALAAGGNMIQLKL